jgi:AraC family transcriptional regulator
MTHSGLGRSSVAVAPAAVAYPPKVAPKLLKREAARPVMVRTSPVREDDRRHLDMEAPHASRVALVGQLSASIVREVEQPITGVITNAKVALGLLSAEPANVGGIREAIMRVVRDGMRAGDLIGRIRALVKEAPLWSDPLEINDAILEALSQTQGEIVKRRLSVHVNFAGDPPPIRGNRVAEAVRTLDDVRHAMERDPKAARAAAVRLVTLLNPTAAGEPPCVRGGLAPWQQRAVGRYMRQRLEGPLRVKELAEQVSLSVSHFCRAFKESFGTTPHLYLTRLRVERAQRLMLTTAEPLSQIALACGMADQAHLSKLFRRAVGETPSSWRRRNLTDAHAEAAHRRPIDGTQ